MLLLFHLLHPPRGDVILSPMNGMSEYIVASSRQESRASATLEILGVAGLLAVGALLRVPLPFSPVPVTMQTFCVLIAPFLTRPGRASAGIGLYVALGLAGAPLFAVTGGATLGYLAGFVAAPWIVTAFRRPAWGMIAAMGVIYALGAVWLSVWLGASMFQAVMVGVLPFLPGDMLKLIAAHQCASRFCQSNS